MTLPRTAPGAARPHDREVWWWVFMRVSAILLLVLAVGWFLDRHLVHDRGSIDYDFVADRWRNPFWRMWDLALLLLVAAHGGRGLRNVVDDLVASEWRRGALKVGVTIGASLVALVAVVAVVGFSPAP